MKKTTSTSNPKNPIHFKWPVFFLLFIACLAVWLVYFSAASRNPPPTAPDRLGVFVGEFQNFPEPKPLQEEAADLIRRHLAGTVAARQIDVRLLNREVSDAKPASLVKLAESLNAAALVGHVKSADASAIVLYFRIPPETPEFPRPDLRRMESSIVYPKWIRVPVLGESERPEAINLLKAHLLLASANGSMIPSLFAQNTTQRKDESLAEANLMAGVTLLASAICANGGREALDLAVRHLSASHEALQDSGLQGLARVNLASAYLHRGNVADTENAALALELLLKEKAQKKSSVGSEILDLATLLKGQILLSSPDPKRTAENQIKEGLRLIKELEETWPRSTHPYGWARVQMLLAQGLGKLGGSRTDEAITRTVQALKVWTRDPYPGEWAGLQSLLGSLYLQRSAKNPEDAKLAVMAFENSLQVWQKQTSPDEWARNMSLLATARLHLKGGKPDEHVRQSIRELEEVLQATDREANPQEWASLQNLLGVAWRRLTPSPERSRKALEHFAAALVARDAQRHPLEAARTLANMGNAYRDFPAAGDERLRYLNLALKAYNAALQTIEDLPDPALSREIQKNRSLVTQELEHLTQ